MKASTVEKEGGGGGKPVYMENWRNNVRWDIWAHLFLG